MKKTFLIFFIAVLCVVASRAQSMPISTDAESALWYYVCTADQKVWTASGTDVVVGEKITDSEAEGFDNQLWRFEGSAANGYLITNKATGTQVCLMYNVSEKKVALRLVKSDKFKFVCQAAGEAVQFVSQTPASTSYGSDVAVCTNTTPNGRLLATTVSQASAFSLEAYIDNELSVSDDANTYWYRISSCAEGLENYAISSNDASDMPLPLIASDISDYQSQWMVSKNEDGLLQFSNRATGCAIAASSVENDAYNITQVAEQKEDGGWFKSQYAGANHYMLSSVEDDGVIRYLIATEQDALAVGFPAEDTNKSAVVWKFELVDTELTGIDGAQDTHVSIRPDKGRIFVSGASLWHIYNLQGVEMPRTTALPAGTYIVSTPQKTIKVNLTK